MYACVNIHHAFCKHVWHYGQLAVTRHVCPVMCMYGAVAFLRFMLMSQWPPLLLFLSLNVIYFRIVYVYVINYECNCCFSSL